jgi:hypothetical protein
VWPVIFSCVSWLTDQRPTLEVTSRRNRSRSTRTSTKPWPRHERLLERDVHRQLSRRRSTRRCDAHTYQIGYLKATWEPWLADGIGDAAFRRADPFSVYPDLFARNVADMTHIIEVHHDDLPTSTGPGRVPANAWALVAVEQSDEAPHVLDETVNQSMPRPSRQPPRCDDHPDSLRTLRQQP